MNENHEDTANNNLTTAENKLWLPPSYINNKTPTPPAPKKRGINWGFAGKTGWNYLNLVGILLVPLMIVVFTLVSYIQQTQTAMDQQRETTLKTYLDDMSDLLLNHNLRTSKPEAEVSRIARARTLTTLRRLDADRNTILLRFLREVHLIGIQNAVINLSNADLSNDDLRGADLSGIDLSGATLNGATLNDADLSGAFLGGADLSNANLSYADLSGAYLRGTSLSDADLSGATLNGATLNDADLSNAILNGAILNGAVLSYANLSYATLNGAILSGAFLGGADLSNADLSNADLSNAILSNAILSNAILSNARNLYPDQLNKVYSCTNAILSPTILSTKLPCYSNRSSGSIVTLTYWYTEGTAETPVIRQLIDQFQQQNPNIRINAVYKPFLRTRTAFITAAQAGNAPDVLRSDIGWVTQFAKRGFLLPIDSCVSQSDRSDYMSVPLSYDPLSYDEYNRHLYGLPQVTDFLALLYNKAELKKAGIPSPPPTMLGSEGLEADAMKVLQSKAATYGFETTGTSYYVLPFLLAFGGMIDQHNNKILLNNEGSVKGLKFLLNLQNTDQVMPPKVDLSNDSTTMVDDFMSGTTAMIFDGPWDISNILKNGSAFKGNPGNLGIAAIPMSPSGDKPRSPVGGQSYVISAHTAHPAEAYKFISFMSSRDSQVAIAKANHTLPTRQSAYQDPSVSDDPFISAFHAIKNTADARPAIPQGIYLFDVFDPDIQAALDGTENPTDALNAVAELWKELVASR